MNEPVVDKIAAMSIDINTVCNVVSAGSTFALAIIAGLTAKSWQKQYWHNRKADAASEALMLAPRAKDSVIAIRSAFGWPNEGKTRQRLKDEKPEESQRLDDAFVAMERLEQRDKLFGELRAHRYTMIALFGPEQKDVFEPAIKFSRDILKYTRRMFAHIRERSRHPNRELSQQTIEAWRKCEEEFDALRWEDDENDSVNQQINKMVEQLEKLNESFR
jgi:Spy/CpxP family protein refolding chaperone